MSGNTSATGGYLAPTTATPEDAALAAVVQALVAGVTGLDPDTGVVIRWQPVPAQQPPRSTNWASVGITHREPDANPAVLHSSAGDGSSTLYRHERLSILCSFYGPGGCGNAAALRDGLYIAQNRDALAANNMGLIHAGEIVTLPDLVNGQTLGRWDISITLRREIIRTYAVENLLSAAGTVTIDSNSGTWTAQE